MIRTYQFKPGGLNQYKYKHFNGSLGIISWNKEKC